MSIPSGYYPAPNYRDYHDQPQNRSNNGWQWSTTKIVIALAVISFAAYSIYASGRIAALQEIRRKLEDGLPGVIDTINNEVSNDKGWFGRAVEPIMQLANGATTSINDLTASISKLASAAYFGSIGSILFGLNAGFNTYINKFKSGVTNP